MKTLEIELPDALAARLEELIEEGRFTGEAEIVRLALAEYLRRRPFELEERFLREDLAWALGQSDADGPPADSSGERDRFVESVEEGLADAEAGRVISDEELGRYLDEEISLAKLAGMLGVSRFELQESCERLGLPVRLGPATLEEARDEVKVARDLA